MRPLILLLLLAPALASAGTWTKVGGDKDGIILLDKASLHVADGGKKAFTMQSFRKPQSAPDGKQYLSVKSQHLYNCDEGAVTLLSQDFYTEVLGRGEPLGRYKYESYDPEHIEADSPLAGAMKAVCRPASKRR